MTVTKRDTLRLPGGRDTVAWYPTITPTGDSIYYDLIPWRIGISPSGFRFSSGGSARVDTIRVPVPGPVVHDTVYVLAPSSNTPELPRAAAVAAIDSMIKASRAADLNTSSWPHLRQDATGKWVCYLNCTPAALTQVKTMNAKPKTTPKKVPATKPRKEPVG